MQQGIQQGRAAGKLEGMLETARKMLSKHFSIEDIIDLTGLSLEQVQALSAQTV